jgi:UTP:GlnB (protein PII) uridylyltransferase
MPEDYRATFDEATWLSHARIVARRQGRPATGGLFPSWGNDAVALCLVADDRPGLLSLMSTALLLTGLEVVDGEAYTRQRPEKKAEAVDLFWVRWHDADRDEPIDEACVEQVVQVLTALLKGGPAGGSGHWGRVQAMAPREAQLRFVENPEGSLTVLEVEAVDRFGLLLSLSRALHRQRVQIVRSEVHTTRERVIDRFTLTEQDGSPVSDQRRLQLQVAVLAALEEEIIFEY